MDEIQVNNYMKLGLAKLSIGELAEAEIYFQEILKTCNYAPAWLALGDTMLAGLFKTPDPGNIKPLVNNAFYFYGEAKRANPHDAEKIEIKIIDTSFSYIIRYHENIKALHDRKGGGIKTADNLLLLGALMAGGGNRNNNQAGSYFINMLIQEKNIENSMGQLLQSMAFLRDKTTSAIEFALDYRNGFIDAVYKKEKELEWYIMDEKQKQQLQNNTSQEQGNQLAIESSKPGTIKTCLAVIVVSAIILLAGFIVFQLIKNM